MAEEQLYDVSPEPTYYFYVNKSTEMVEYVSMYTIFGITVRPKGEKWTMGTRNDLDKYYSADYEIWSYDWENSDDTPGSGSNLDPADEDSWEIEPIQDWAKGQDITREEISKWCVLVNSGEYISPEEAAKIPGE